MGVIQKLCQFYNSQFYIYLRCFKFFKEISIWEYELVHLNQAVQLPWGLN